MTVEIKIPAVGESITEVFVGEWYVSEGDWVEADQSLAGLETDKATFDVPAPSAGVVSKVLLAVGETAAIGDVLGEIDETATPPKTQNTAAPPITVRTTEADSESVKEHRADATAMPSARRALHEAGLDASEVEGSGRAGRVRKEDVSRHLTGGGTRETRAVPLSPIRKTIAHRLVSAQQNAALLTTFNEVDLTVVKTLRARHQDAFTKKYGIKLGFMSFFVKAVVDSLRHHPAINAQFDDDRLVYHNYYDIGIAVGGGKGLVVPVLRNAENMSFAEIELSIADFGRRAQKNAIGLDELEGGTFTITNGGVYGSLLSTPIVNPPQSGVLGMHGIVDRPVALDGEVVIRPMMYTALTYDHRVVDGKDAVTFLKRISNVLEDPTRMILEI